MRSYIRCLNVTRKAKYVLSQCHIAVGDNRRIRFHSTEHQKNFLPFEHFLQQQNADGPVELSNNNESVPYLQQEEFSGHGQKGALISWLLSLRKETVYFVISFFVFFLVYCETYGCQMNVNDTDIVWSILKAKGYERTTDVAQVVRQNQPSNVLIIELCKFAPEF